MRIGTVDIAVPFLELGGNPLSARGNWVHQIARALSDINAPAKSLPTVLRNSREYPVIVQHLAFLKLPEPELYNKENKELRLHKVASALAEDVAGPRTIIDALLLGGRSYKHIADQLDDGRSDKKELLALVALYETLFMHCRKPDASLLPAVQLRALALDGRDRIQPGEPAYVHWRFKAATEGYAAVEPLFGILPESTDEFMELSFKSTSIQATAVMDNRLRTGSVSNEEAISLMSLAEDNAKRKSDENIAAKAASQGGSLDYQALTLLVGLKMPERVAVEDYAKDPTKATAAEKRNLASEQKISKTVVTDRGPVAARAAQDKKLKEHLDKEAARQEGGEK